MPHGFLHMLGVIAPTLFLMQTAIPANTRAFMPYSEYFGAGDYLLEVYFKANPQGPLRNQDTDPLAFEGYFINHGKEERISGIVQLRKGQRQYVFHSARGKFVGSLAAERGRCEPKMNFRLESDSTAPTEIGTLNAAFCPQP